LLTDILPLKMTLRGDVFVIEAPQQSEKKKQPIRPPASIGSLTERTRRCRGGHGGWRSANAHGALHCLWIASKHVGSGSVISCSCDPTLGLP
jgi:hypothetical protein